MLHHMEVVPGVTMNDEKELKELLHRADVECERRMKASGTIPKVKGKVQPRYNDRLQDHIQQLVNRSFAEARKRPTGTAGFRPSGTLSEVRTGKTRRLEDIPDDVLIRSICEPTILDLDEGGLPEASADPRPDR